MNYLYFGQIMQFFNGEIYRYSDIMGENALCGALQAEFALHI